MGVTYVLVALVIGVFLAIMYLGVKDARSDGLLSMNETKKSVLIYTFIVSMMVGWYMTIISGDLPSNLMTMNIALGGYIFGFNTAKIFTEGKVQEAMSFLNERKESEK